MCHICFYNLIEGITISHLHIFNASEWGLEKWFFLYILLYIYMTVYNFFEKYVEYWLILKNITIS